MKQALRRARDWPPANALLTSAVRRVVRHPSERVLSHLPRQGEVEVEIPGADPIRFWSAADDWITSRLWWRGLAGFEPETVEVFLRFAREADVVLDVGAYTGFYSLVAAAVRPAARVFAFEPHPHIAARLGHNISLNPGLEVTMLPFAVGRRREMADFHVSGPNFPSSSSLSAAWAGLYETRRVPVIDLESFAGEWGLDRIDLVKIDVEQGEPDVVAGMGSLLESHRPVIVCEVLPGADEQYAEMSERLRSSNYRFFHLTEDGPVPEAALRGPDEYIDHVTTMVNHLACPAEKQPSWLPRE